MNERWTTYGESRCFNPRTALENCGFSTQKPEALLQRIVLAASSEGDLVADFLRFRHQPLSGGRKAQSPLDWL